MDFDEVHAVVRYNFHANHSSNSQYSILQFQAPSWKVAKPLHQSKTEVELAMIDACEQLFWVWTKVIYHCRLNSCLALMQIKGSARELSLGTVTKGFFQRKNIKRQKIRRMCMQT